MPELAQNINSLTFYIINEENVLVKLSLSHFRWLCRYGFSNVTLCLVLMSSILRAGHTKQYCILAKGAPPTMLPRSWLCSSTELVIWYKSHFLLLSSVLPLTFFPSRIRRELEDESLHFLPCSPFSEQSSSQTGGAGAQSWKGQTSFKWWL